MPNRPKAFLVYGPESSGTRLTRRLFIEMGCYGDGGNKQRLNDYIPKPIEGRHLVWGKSIPSDYSWPDIREEIHRVLLNGYDPIGVVTFRDWYAMSNSQVENKHVHTLQAAQTNIHRAYEHIFRNMFCPYIIMSYENILTRPQHVIGVLSETFGLPYVELTEEIIDGNNKYYHQLDVPRPFYRMLYSFIETLV